MGFCRGLTWSRSACPVPTPDFGIVWNVIITMSPASLAIAPEYLIAKPLANAGCNQHIEDQELRAAWLPPDHNGSSPTWRSGTMHRNARQRFAVGDTASLRSAAISRAKKLPSEPAALNEHRLLLVHRAVAILAV
jgi:hypothetical protein